jgi:chemotaxis signal transduction protein
VPRKPAASRRWRSASICAANPSAFWSTQVGEVLKLADDDREPNPINLDRKLAALAAGVHRLDGQLLVVLDIDRVLDLVPKRLAA